MPPMAAEETMSFQRAESVDHQLIRAIGVPGLTANIVNATIGAGIFVLPALVAKGLRRSTRCEGGVAVSTSLAVLIFLRGTLFPSSRESQLGSVAGQRGIRR